MTDETEQKLDAPRIESPTDALIKPASIRTREDEAIWEAMQQPHKLGKHESATHIGLTPEVIAEMQKKGQGSKLELFDSKAEEALAAIQKTPTEQILVASNITPVIPNIEQQRQYSDIQTDSPALSPEAIIAKEAQQGYQGVRNDLLGREIVRVAIPSGATDRAVFPFRGVEDARLADCTKQNPQAWNEAFAAFPDLGHYLSGQDGTRLMKALVRNELHNYDVKDHVGDTMARFGHVDSTETLGYPQITPLGLKQFEDKYPQLKAFIASKGHTGAHAEADALRDPACTPMIVAAKLQSEVDTLKNAQDKLQPENKVQINWRSLAYTYNADVYYNPKTPLSPDFHANIIPKAKEIEHLRGYEKAYPTSDERALSQSQHVKNVEEQMKLIR